jgi:hypothetical protein
MRLEGKRTLLAGKKQYYFFVPTNLSLSSRFISLLEMLSEHNNMFIDTKPKL